MSSAAGRDSSRDDPPTRGAEAAHKVASLIAISLALGVTLFAVVALALAGSGDVESTPTGALFRAWLATVVVTVVAAAIAWRRMVVPLLPATDQRVEPPANDTLRRLQTGLIVCLGLVEGGALFGCVVTLLGGGALPAVTGVLLMWVAFALLRPRRGWYGLR